MRWLSSIKQSLQPTIYNVFHRLCLTMASSIISSGCPNNRQTDIWIKIAMPSESSHLNSVFQKCLPSIHSSLFSPPKTSPASISSAKSTPSAT